MQKKGIFQNFDIQYSFEIIYFLNLCLKLNFTYMLIN